MAKVKSTLRKGKIEKKNKKSKSKPAAEVDASDEDEVVESGNEDDDDDNEENDNDNEEEEEEEEEAGDEEDDEEEDEEGGEEEVSDDEVQSEGEEDETEEEKEKRLRTVRRTKSRRRGYRTIAIKGGFSQHFVAGDASRDVSKPIVSLNEVIRACKWAPGLADKAAYENIAEFEERTRLSLESLPKGAAKVIAANGEVYARKMAIGAVQIMSDQLKTRVSAAMMASVLRPLQREQQYSFVAPLAAVRHAQTVLYQGERLGMLDGDLNKIEEEKKLLTKQVEVKKAVHKEVTKRKADLLAKKQETPEGGVARKMKKQKVA
tara:strand:- start:2738 stop:3694 length:957 start_codon:yes stop_codon:yes gene_type:complete